METHQRWRFASGQNRHGGGFRLDEQRRGVGPDVENHGGLSAETQADGDSRVHGGEILVNDRVEVVAAVELLVEVAQHDQSSPAACRRQFALLLGTRLLVDALAEEHGRQVFFQKRPGDLFGQAGRGGGVQLDGEAGFLQRRRTQRNHVAVGAEAGFTEQARAQGRGGGTLDRRRDHHGHHSPASGGEMQPEFFELERQMGARHGIEIRKIFNKDRGHRGEERLQAGILIAALGHRSRIGRVLRQSSETEKMVFQILRRGDKDRRRRTSALDDGPHAAGGEFLAIEVGVESHGAQGLADALRQPTALVGPRRDDQRYRPARHGRVERGGDQRRGAPAAGCPGQEQVESVPPVAVLKIVLHTAGELQAAGPVLLEKRHLIDRRHHAAHQHGPEGGGSRYFRNPRALHFGERLDDTVRRRESGEDFFDHGTVVELLVLFFLFRRRLAGFLGQEKPGKKSSQSAVQHAHFDTRRKTDRREGRKSGPGHQPTTQTIRKESGGKIVERHRPQGCRPRQIKKASLLLGRVGEARPSKQAPQQRHQSQIEEDFPAHGQPIHHEGRGRKGKNQQDKEQGQPNRKRPTLAGGAAAQVQLLGLESRPPVRQSRGNQQTRQQGNGKPPPQLEIRPRRGRRLHVAER